MQDRHPKFCSHEEYKQLTNKFISEKNVVIFDYEDCLKIAYTSNGSLKQGFFVGYEKMNENFYKSLYPEHIAVLIFENGGLVTDTFKVTNPPNFYYKFENKGKNTIQYELVQNFESLFILKKFLSLL